MPAVLLSHRRILVPVGFGVNLTQAIRFGGRSCARVSASMAASTSASMAETIPPTAPWAVLQYRVGSLFKGANRGRSQNPRLSDRIVQSSETRTQNAEWPKDRGGRLTGDEGSLVTFGGYERMYI
jgi:hypothetical protein